MRPCQPPVERHIVSSTRPWALPPEFHKQDPCKGSSPYFCWRTAVVVSRALRRKWRTVKSLTSQSPEPTRVPWTRTSKISALTMLCSLNPWLILLNPKNSKLSLRVNSIPLYPPLLQSCSPPWGQENVTTFILSRPFLHLPQPSNSIPMPKERDSPAWTNDAKLSRHRQVNYSWA